MLLLQQLREQHKHSGRNARRDSCGNNYDVATPSAPAHLLLLLLLLPYHIQLTSSAIVPITATGIHDVVDC
jgi:hypothetical protein